MNYKDKRIKQFREKYDFVEMPNEYHEGLNLLKNDIEQFLSETIDRAQREVAEEIKMSIAREYDSYEMLSYTEVMKHIEKYTKGEKE